MRTLVTAVAAAVLLAMLACGTVAVTSEGEAEEEVVEVIKEGPPHYGTHGRASVDEMVASSPVIVRATLDSVRAVGLETTHSDYVSALEYTINVVGYLKGSGSTTLKPVAIANYYRSFATEDVARRETEWLLDARDKRWDDRQAIVFLRRHPAGSGYLVNGSQMWWLGEVGRLGSDRTFTVASREARVWLPDAAATRIPGPAQSVQQQRFLLEDPALSGAAARSTAGTTTTPAITLTGLKGKIADMERRIMASSDPEAYRECLAKDLETKRKNALKEPVHEERPASIGSGQPAGTKVWTFSWAEELVREYETTPPSGDNFGEDKTWWFEGADAAVLRLQYVYPGDVVTGRPLPAGEYRAFMRTRGPEGWYATPLHWSWRRGNISSP